jgi:hypothetical protein
MTLITYIEKPLRQRGLARPGIFAVNTQNEDDLAYLEELVASYLRYVKYTAKKGLKKTYLGQRGAVSKPKSIYVKIDDDVVSPLSLWQCICLSICIR